MLFETPPEDFKPNMTLAACMVRYQDQFLLLLRQPRKMFGERWGFPGAKVKMDTDAKDVVVREIMVGAGIMLDKDIIRPYKTFSVKVPEGDIIYNLYVAELNTKPTVHISTHDYKGYVWATPVEAFKLPMALGEDECIKMYFGLKKPVIKRITNTAWEVRDNRSLR